MRVSRWLHLGGTAALSLVLFACDHTPEGLDDAPEETASRQRETPRPKPAVETGDTLATLQKRAEAGEVSAMLALGRAHEALSGELHKAEAKKWYDKAAATGDESAKEALRMMAAQAAAATRAAAEAQAQAQAQTLAQAQAQTEKLPAATHPAPTTPSPTPDSTASAPPTAAPPTTAPAINLGAVTWQEVLASFDNSDFVTVSRPGYRKTPADKPIFVGLTTAPDKTFTLAASGPLGDQLDAVSIVLRIRNRQNIERNNRVIQSAAVLRTVTRGNVEADELAQWVESYLMTGAPNDPVFRNGWSITVSGTSGAGMPDPKKHLGEAVLIELKR